MLRSRSEQGVETDEVTGECAQQDATCMPVRMRLSVCACVQMRGWKQGVEGGVQQLYM